jgi:lysophospholipase L1-like esterase
MKMNLLKAARWAWFLMCFFVTIEVACRIDQWRQYGAPILGQYSYDSALFTMDEHGIRGKPYGAYEKWRLNSLGFRGPEFAGQPDHHRMRVICIGASETFGLYESVQKEWPMQLERMLVRSGENAEVVNAAIPGMGMQQRLIHLRYRLLPLQPNVVLFMLEYGSYAGLTPQRVEDRKKQIAKSIEPMGFLSPMKSLRSAVRLKEALVGKLPEPMQPIWGTAEREFKLLRIRREMGDSFGTFKEVTPFESAQFLKDLAELHNLTSRAGVRLVLVSPAMWLNENTLALMSLSWPYVDKSWWLQARDKFSASASEFASSQGLEFVDLTHYVKGHESDWMKDMLHFTDEGSYQIANEIMRTIEHAPGKNYQAAAIQEMNN